MARSRSRKEAGISPATGAGVAGPAALSAALQVHLLTETARLFGTPLSLGRILEKFVELIAGSSLPGAVLLLLREEGGTGFHLQAGRGLPRGADRRAGIPGNDPLLKPVVDKNRPLLATDLSANKSWRRSCLRALCPPDTKSLLALPLAIGGCTGGMLVLVAPRGGRCCDASDLEWFLPIAEQVSFAIEKALQARRREGDGHGLQAALRLCERELRETRLALRRCQAEVRDLRGYSEQVIASLAGGLVTFDDEGRVTTANPAALNLLHLGSGSVEGRSLADLFSEPFAAALMGKLRRRQVRIVRAQATISVGLGEEKVIGYSVTPLRRVRAGRLWILLFRDLTDSQRLGNELRRLERLVSLGEISANVAHELKNPLTVMYANMEWLLEKLPEEFRRRVQITIDHMERMEGIIARMGILSKDQPLVARPIDLGDLVAQMLTFVDKTLREKKIDVDVSVPRAPLWIQGDPAQLHQALLNIIMNAAQAIGSNGMLAVRLESRAHGGRRGCELSLEDSGPGIPPHLLGRIFEPFFTTKETGTGLGLAITSQIVAAHKGKITAENNPGGGACIRLWFPTSPSGR